MQNIIYEVHKLLLKTDKTLAIAESCTGGLLLSLLTRNPGSSRYLKLGVVAYSNEAKKAVLRVPKAIILKYGAVSRKTAVLMATNVRRIIKADFGIAITGIAGPKGASDYKPVGTVFIAVSDTKKTTCVKFLFRGGRSAIQRESALKALKLLKKIIQCASSSL